MTSKLDRFPKAPKTTLAWKISLFSVWIVKKSSEKSSDKPDQNQIYSVEIPNVHESPLQQNHSRLNNGLIPISLEDLASRNLSNDLMNNNNNYNTRAIERELIVVKKRKPKCKIKRSVTFIKKPRHSGRVFSLKKVCKS